MDQNADANLGKRLRTLLESPAPAVLTTYREDGSAFVAPVWFRWTGEAFEIVVGRATQGVLLRLRPESPRVWDLSKILPG